MATKPHFQPAGNTDVLESFTAHTEDGFHAQNNKFQFAGPTGFLEMRNLDNQGNFLRIDIPGVDEADFRTWRQGDSLYFCGTEQKSEHEDCNRTYFGSVHLVSCGCCKVSGYDINLKNGVLTVTALKNMSDKVSKDNLHRREAAVSAIHKSCLVFTDSKTLISPSMPVGFSSSHNCGVAKSPELNPFQLSGSPGECEVKVTPGDTYVRVDMPGVADEDAEFYVKGGEVRFKGDGKNLGNEDARKYLGSIELVSAEYKLGEVKGKMKNGVLRMMIQAVEFGRI